MIFEIVKQKNNGKIKVFRIDCDLEYLKDKLNKDKGILSAWQIVEGKRQGTPVYWKLTKDKLLSMQGSWNALEKYNSREA